MSDINLDDIKDYAFHAKPCTSESCRDNGMILVVGLPFAECLARDLKAARAEVERLTKERDEARAILDFHPRAAKLMAKRKSFIVIAHDEPYFMGAYSMIAIREMQTGRWTREDELAYQLAGGRVKNIDREWWITNREGDKLRKLNDAEIAVVVNDDAKKGVNHE